MAVKYDMRKMEQPVTMNSNPFVHGHHRRLSLKPIDGFSATVSEAMTASSSPGPYQSQTTTTSMGANEAQSKAFEKIGGDRVMTITDVRLQVESMGINLLLAMGSGVKIMATGAVQRIVLLPETHKETAK